ncbi:hypothetical protein RND81_07G140500 [Saponaria officinalis]|uniref:F-box domain-containing protein n=1 Tax=Saponaria officinalis TaxID=3572 RepID=A0AAW1JUK4_SAPOF
MALTKSSLSISHRRKRILISKNCCDLEQFCPDFVCFTPMKKLCSHKINLRNSSNFLEDLPQELLIKVICGVYHDDLKQLFVVSKTIRNAAIIAKNCHFAYSTPLKTKSFRNSIEMLNNNSENSSDFEPPKAPKPVRRMSRRPFNRKTLGSVAIKLFDGEVVIEAEQRWPRRSLFMEIDS